MTISLVNLNLGRRLFESKVVKGVKPLLLMPETNALSERLYSKLTRIKTYHKSNVNHNRSTTTGKFYTTWIFFFFSLWVFFHEHSRFTGQQEKEAGIFLTPLYHFQPFHRDLNVGCTITAESSHVFVWFRYVVCKVRPTLSGVFSNKGILKIL